MVHHVHQYRLSKVSVVSQIFPTIFTIFSFTLLSVSSFFSSTLSNESFVPSIWGIGLLVTMCSCNLHLKSSHILYIFKLFFSFFALEFTRSFINCFSIGFFSCHWSFYSSSSSVFSGICCYFFSINRIWNLFSLIWICHLFSSYSHFTIAPFCFIYKCFSRRPSKLLCYSHQSPPSSLRAWIHLSFHLQE